MMNSWLRAQKIGPALDGNAPCPRRLLILKEHIPMKDSLSGKKIAFLATDGVEQVELTKPKKTLEAAGATIEILAPKSGEIKAWKSKDWGEKLKVDKSVGHADVSDYDALVLPGGVMNPDHLRTEPD